MENQSGNAGNQGGNAWNQVGNLGNQGGSVGNQGGNAGNQGENVGNAGNQYKGNIKLMKCHHPADISISPPSSEILADTIHEMLPSLLGGVLSQSNELDSHQTKKQKDVISDRPHVLISFIHWVDRTIKRVTNSPAVAYKS